MKKTRLSPVNRITASAYLRIGGIKEESDEDCYTTTSFLFCNEMGVTINDAEIDRVHRVGKPGRTTPQMIVMFKGYHAKQEVLKNRHKLKGKRGLYVKEDLTAYNLELFHYARAAEFVSSMWSNDSKVLHPLLHVMHCCNSEII